MKNILLSVFLIACFNGSASTFSQDIVGDGSITSSIHFGDVGNFVRAESGSFAVGNKLTVEENSLGWYSGFNLENGSDGSYRVWGRIGDTSHSININDASGIYMIGQYYATGNMSNDMDVNGEYVNGGQTSISGNFTGSSVEKIRAESENGKPIDLSTTRLDGTFEINSEVKI